MPGEKRKTHTSSAVKRKYNSKVYARVSVELPKELVSEFKALCKENGESQASIVKKAIEQYIAEHKAEE